MQLKKASEYGITRADVRAAKERTKTEPKFALDVFKTVHAAQKPEEQFTLRHKGHDGRGFRESESYTLNRFYEVLEGQNWLMTPAQMEMLMQRVEPYTEQFLRLNAEATEKRTAELAKAELAKAAAKERLAKPAAKVNKHPPRRKLSKVERQRILDNVNSMPD